MAQTVIGFFDSYSDAQNAVAQLANAGISRERVDISSGNNSRGNVSDDTSRRDNDDNAITRFFKNLFGDDDEQSSRYSNAANSSDAMVTVHAQSDTEAQRAADLLDQFGAIDVDERSSGYGAASGGRMETSSDSNAIPIIREDLDVDKRMEERGSVRVRSRIIERPVEEHVRLREEHVRVERNPVDRPISSNDLGAFRESEIELTERAEVPVVNKEARVVEEVRLTKEVTERDETIRDTLRSTDVDIDQDGTQSNRDSLRDDVSSTGTSGGGYDIGTADYRNTEDELRSNRRLKDDDTAF